MIWGEGDDAKLICRAVWPETADVKTFLFSPATPAQFRFSAGQFLTFTFPVDGAEIQRCYSIASPPTRPNTIAITVKHKPGGVVSPWLHARLRPGMAVTATGPMGTFTDEVAGGSKWALLAAGSGITPVMSMLRRAADLGEDRDIVLIDSAHTPSDLIFHDELAILARALSGLRIIHLVSQGHPGWSGLRGRLSRATLELLVPDLRERAVFCCGPPAYGAAVQGWAAEIGCHPANYHTESFNFESAEAELSPAPAQSDVQLYTITFAQSGRTLTCDAATTVLAAARQAGLRLPFSCAKGVCGTCKTKIISGDVEMTHNGGIRPREIAQGLALLCCSRPKTDLLVDR